MSHLHGWLAVRGSLWKIFGAGLMFVGVALAALHMQATLEYMQAVDAHGGAVTDLDRVPAPQAAQHASVVRVVGPLTVVDAPRDPQFNLSVATPLLTRRVEMFQWREVPAGGRVQYELDWADHPIDASRFREPGGHANPARFPLPGQHFRAGAVRIGSLQLGPVLQRALPPDVVPVAPDPPALPANLAASFSRHGDYLQTSARADNPQPGDIRVSWSAVPLETVTVIARLVDGQLQPAPDATDGQGFEIMRGDVSLLDLFPDRPVAPTAGLLKRGLALALAVLGALVLLTACRRARAATTYAPPRARWWVDVLLALGAGTLAVATVAIALWAGHDNQRAAYWLAVAALAAALSIWQIQHRR